MTAFTVFFVVLCCPALAAAAQPQESERSRDDSVETYIDVENAQSQFNDELNRAPYKRLRTNIKRYEFDPDWEWTRGSQSQAPGWWTRFWAWVKSWFQSNPNPNRRGTTGAAPAPAPSSSSGSSGFTFSFGEVGFGTMIVWIILGLLLLVITAIIIRSAALRLSGDKDRPRLESELDPDGMELNTPPGEIPADEYMHRAMQLAEKGDHRRALRQLVLGGMSWIERAGLIRFRKGLTNRDYVRAVYRREQQRKRFQGIILHFEKVYYGRRDADEEQFDKCLERYRRAFGQEPNAEALRREAEAAARAEEQKLRTEQEEISAAAASMTNNMSARPGDGPIMVNPPQFDGFNPTKSDEGQP